MNTSPAFSRRVFMQGAVAAAALPALPTFPLSAAAAAQPVAPASSGVMALFEDCDGYWSDLTMAIGAPDAEPRALAEELLDEMIERDSPADVLPSEMVIEHQGEGALSSAWSEMPEENRPAAIAYLAAQFRPGFGRWDCASRGRDYPEDCAICTQCATGNDLICGGNEDELRPFFDTCRPDAPGAAPYLIWGGGM